MGSDGQVTIWIIVGVIIIAIVALFVILFRIGILPSPLNPSVDKNPNSFLRSCLEEDVQKAEQKMMVQGGSLNPELSKTFMFTEEGIPYNITYLCYSQDTFHKCVNQKPGLLLQMGEEMANALQDNVVECFDDLESSYKNAGYDVSISGSGHTVTIQEGEIVVSIEKTVKLSKGDEGSILKDFRVTFPSNLYDFTVIASEIVNSETTKCDYDIQQFLKLNPYKNLAKIRTVDGSDIYTITERSSEEFFRFAVKGGCLNLL